MTKVYLDVDYEKREIVKKHGAKWDKYENKWWIPSNHKDIYNIINIANEEGSKNEI